MKIAAGYQTGIKYTGNLKQDKDIKNLFDTKIGEAMLKADSLNKIVDSLDQVIQSDTSIMNLINKRDEHGFKAIIPGYGMF